MDNIAGLILYDWYWEWKMKNDENISNFALKDKFHIGKMCEQTK